MVKAEKIETDLERLIWSACLAADIRVSRLPLTATGADRTSAAVEAAFEHAVVNGLIEIKPVEEWPYLLKLGSDEDDQ